MPLSNWQAQDFLARLRKTNPQAENLSDVELAQTWQKQTGTQDLDEFINQSSMLRTVGKLGLGYERNVVAPVREGIDKLVGSDPNEDSFAGKFAGSVLNMVPSAAILGTGAYFAPETLGTSFYAAMAASAMLERERALAETGDQLYANVAGASMLLGSAAGKIASQPLLRLAEKELVSGIMTREGLQAAAKTFGINYGLNVATELPEFLFAPTGVEDQDIVDRVAENSHKLMRGEGLGDLLGQTLALSGTGQAYGSGQLASMRRQLKQADTTVPINSERQQKFGNYTEAREYLSNQGIEPYVFENQILVKNMAERMAAGEPYVDKDYVRYQILRAMPDTSPEKIIDSNWIKNYETNVLPGIQRSQIRNLLQAANIRSQRPKSGLANIVSILSHKSIEDAALYNPESYSGYLENFAKLPEAERIALNRDYGLGPKASGLDLLRSAVIGTRSKRYSIGKLSQLHPFALDVLQRAEQMEFDILRGENKGLTGRLHEIVDKADLAKLQEVIDQQSAAYKGIRDMVESPSLVVNSMRKPRTAEEETAREQRAERELNLRRGAEKMLNRLRLERSLEISRRKKLGEGKDTNIQGSGISDEDLLTLGRFIDRVGEDRFANFALEITTKIPGEGRFNFVNNLVSLAKRASQEGDVTRTLVHEFWHGLSQYLPATELGKFNRYYQSRRNKFFREHPILKLVLGEGRTFNSEGRRKLIETYGEAEVNRFLENVQNGNISRTYRGVLRDKDYRYSSVDEFFAEQMSDESFRTILAEEKGYGTFSKVYDAIVELLRHVKDYATYVFGGDPTGTVHERFTRDESPYRTLQRKHQTLEMAASGQFGFDAFVESAAQPQAVDLFLRKKPKSDAPTEFKFQEFKNATVSAIDKYALTNINLATKYPFSKKLVDILFRLGQHSRADIMLEIGKLGQNPQGTVEARAAFSAARDWLDSLDKTALERFGRAFEEDTKRGAKAEELLSDQDLKNRFKLSDEEIQKYHVLQNMPANTALRIFEGEQTRQTYDLAGCIFLATGKRLRQGDTLQLARLLHKIYETPSEQSKIPMLQALFAHMKLPVDAAMVEKLDMYIITQRNALQAFLESRDLVGYMPQQRRGTYGAVLVKPGVRVADSKPSDRATVDGNNRADVERRIQQKLAEGWTVKSQWDKSSWERGESSYYDINALSEILTRNAEHWREMVAKLKSSGKLGAEEEAFLMDIAMRSDPIKEAFQRGVDGTTSQYNLHRSNVEGFDVTQYIPNVLDYVRINNEAVNRHITRAASEFELLRPEYSGVQGLTQEWKERIRYAYGLDNAALNKVRTAVVHYYLAGSVKNMLINSTQVAIAGIGPMVEHTGSVIKSEAAILRGLKHMAKYNATGTTGDITLDSIIRQADKDGITTVDNLDLYVDTSHIADYSEARNKLGRWKNKTSNQVQRMLAMTNAFSERQNRLWALLAMADVEISRHKKAGKMMTLADRQRIYELATRYSNDVNYFGSRANRPGFMVHAGGTLLHSPLLLATTLKTFTMNYLGQLHSMWVKGGGRKGALRNKPLMAAITHLLLASGLAGLPFSKDIEQLLSSIFGEDLESEMKEGMLDMMSDNPDDNDRMWVDCIMHGFPAYLGINAAQSLGAGSVLNYQSKDSPAENFWANVLGPTGGILERMAKGAEKAIMEGDFESGITQVQPTAVRYFRNLISSMDKSKIYNGQGVPTTTKDEDTLAVLGGFSPQRIENERQWSSYQKIQAEARDKLRERMVHKVARLFAQGDTVAAREEFLGGIQKLGPGVNPDSLLNSINHRVFQLKLGYVNELPALEDVEAYVRANKIYGQGANQVVSPVSELMQKLELSLQLGDDLQVLAILSRFESSLREAILKEAILASGILPQEMNLLMSKQPTNVARGLQVAQQIPETVGGINPNIIR